MSSALQSPLYVGQRPYGLTVGKDRHLFLNEDYVACTRVMTNV